MEIIINIVITTSVTALIILSIKALLRNKISPILQFALWLILALRLLIPVFPESNISIFNAVPQIKNIEASDKVVESIAHEKKTYIMGDVTVGNYEKEFILSKSIVDYAFPMWLIGCFMMFSYIVVSYLLFHRKTKSFKVADDPAMLATLEVCKQELNIYADIKVRLGGEIPLLKGLFVPEIILPEGYAKEDLKSIFLHELMHFKHKDIAWNMLSALFLCAYWYNPIIWVSFFAFRRDMEFLCDYRVLQVFGNRKEYATVLLKTALRKNKFLLFTTAMHNGEKDISKRIKYIAYFKKPKVFWSFTALTIGLIIMSICLTNPLGAGKISDKLDYKSIYKYKTLYVGDASKVGNMTGSLYYAKYKDGFALQTEQQPYGVKVNYTNGVGYLLEDARLVITDEMMQNAAIMFCLIDNVDNITFSFSEEAIRREIILDRRPFDETFGRDIREYADTFRKFRKEFIPKLENEQWDKVDFEVQLFNKVDVYVWRNKEVTGTDSVYYTFLPATNKVKNEKQVYALEPVSTTSIDKINTELTYAEYTHLNIRHDSSFTKDEILKISDAIKFDGESISIGVFGEDFR